MKRLVLFMVLILCCPIVLSKPRSFEKPIHVDPYSIYEFYIPNPSLILYYNEFLDMLIKGNYTRAEEILGILYEAGGPSHIRNLIDRVNSVGNRIRILLNETEYSLSSAESFIKVEDFQDARNEIFKAGKALENANSSLIELRQGLNQLAGSLGVSAGILFQHLKGLEDRIKDLYKWYKDLVLIIYGIEYSKGTIEFKNTFLSIYVEPGIVWFGEEVQVYGWLKDEEGNFLAGEDISVKIGKRVFKIETDLDGFFSLSYKIMVYMDEVNIVALYAPPPEKGLIGCFNSTVLQVQYIKSTIKIVDIDKAVTPGDIINLTIKVTPTDVERHVVLSFDGENVTSYNVRNPLLYSSIKVPLNVKLGLHIIDVFLEPEDIYSYDRERTSILVYLLPINVTLDFPKIVVYPILTASVHGRVLFNNKPISNAKVVLYRNGELIGVVYTDVDGVFLLNLGFPSWLPYRESEYKLLVDPQNPKLSSFASHVLIKEFNLLSFVAIIALAAVIVKSNIIFYAVKKFRRLIAAPKSVVSVREVSGAIIEKAKTLEALLSEKIKKIRARSRIEIDYKGRMGFAYWIYINIIVRFSQLFTPIKHSETYREYLRRIMLKLNSRVREAFAQLTILAEAERYGGKKVDEEIAEELAEEILNEVEE